ncbi:MAG: uracil-DNA glycosylase [Candidatus Eiseniibacteriota bacterium]|nr:MAG: uracil-DNA glycosylase [Candidatus Eisenbacteria bacterium]
MGREVSGVKDLEEFARLISDTRNYFQTRLSLGETSLLLGPREEDRGGGSPAPDEQLARLEERVRSCTRCALHRSRTKVVFGTGTARTGLVFVGEAPGRDEDIQGEPFVGRAGQLLTRIIEAIQLSRDDVYITNVIKCRPEGNRDPHPHEIELCSRYLIEQLEILKPRAICALGRFAAQALSGLKLSMAGYRTEDLFYRGIRVFATYHPAACLRNASLKRPVWEDMQKLRDFLKSS